MLDYRMDTFLMLCECMSYRKTAELLHITQPAVTQQIHLLEREYGCQLFSYDNRRLTKTSSAELLEQYARAERLRDQELRKKLARGKARELRIGATKTIGDYVLTEHICRFLENREHALELTVDNTGHLLRLLEENQLDFAVIEGYFDKKRFDSDLLRREPFVGICGREHPFAGRQVPPEELLTETMIHREEGSGTRAVLEQELLRRNESLQRFDRRVCVSSFKLILELVKRGCGVSFVYEVLADSDPALAKFSLPGAPVVREFNIIWLKGADLSEKIGWFFQESAH